MEVLINLWCLFQNLIGYIFYKALNSRKRILRSRYGKVNVVYLGKGYGYCLGKWIFVNPNSPDGNLLMHEYGHYLQSLILGPLYMFVIFVPSWIHYLIDPEAEDYHSFYTESWANRLSGFNIF